MKDTKEMNLREILYKVVNTKPYENLRELLGERLGSLVYALVNASEKADKRVGYHPCVRY